MSSLSGFSADIPNGIKAGGAPGDGLPA